VESVRTGWTFERAGGVAGLLAAALMLASAAVGSSPDEANATDGRLLEFYGDSGNQYRLYVAALIAVLAGLLFLWFLVVLHDRLSRIDLTGIPSLVFAAGLVFVVLWLVSSAIGTALPASLVYSAELELTDMGSLRVC
jgi:hypothetical protein